MSQYSYLQYPQGIALETPLGVVYLVVPQSDFIVVQTEREYNKVGVITVNKVEYTLNMRLKLGVDGWNLEKSDNGSTYHSLSATRRNWTNVNTMYATDAARNKIKSVLIPLVAKWVEENPEIIAQAAFVKLNNECHSTEQEVNKLRAALVSTEQKLQEQIALLEEKSKVLASMSK